MPRCRWFLAQCGAGLNLCLLTGCIFSSAQKTDPPLVRDPVLVPRDTVAPSYVTRDDGPRELELETIKRPDPPPEPAPISPPQNAVEPPPPIAAPAPPAQPPQPPDPPAIAALRAFLDQKPDSDAARRLLRLSATDHDVLDALLPIVEDAFTKGLDTDLVLKQLNLLEERLRPRRALELNKDRVCFTRNIEGFGVFEPLAPTLNGPVFQSGLDNRPGDRVQVYVEVRNFVSHTVGSYWETSLSSTLEFRRLDLADNPDRKPDVRLQRPARPDRSLSPRQDYYLNIQFHVPPKLPPGLYELKIIVNDENAPAGVVSQAAAPPNEHKLTFRVEPPR